MPAFRERTGFVLMALILILSLFGLARGLLTHGQSSVVTRSVTVQADPTPSVSNVLLNGGNPITLNPAATTSVSVSFTVTDGDGCGDVFYNGTTTVRILRSGVPGGVACGENTLNCYVGNNVTLTFAHSCPNPTSSQQTANATATFGIYHLAQATDASSSFPGEDWFARVSVVDASNNTGTATSTGLELNSLLAISLATTSINYGEVLPGTNTGGANQVIPILNAGNSSTSLRIYGEALVSGPRSLPTSSQHYATSTFVFGGLEQILSAAAQAVSGFIVSSKPMEIWTLEDTVMPLEAAQLRAIAHEGYLYAVGGDATSTVFYAPLSVTGTVGIWQATTLLPGLMGNLGAAKHGDFLYVSGGFFPGTTTVAFASFQASGTLTAFQETTPLPHLRREHGMASFGNYMYIAGGSDENGSTSSVIFAPVNATGSLGAWQAATPLPATIVRVYGFAHEERIYFAGSNSLIYAATPGADGSITSWMEIGQRNPAFNPALVAAENLLFSLGSLEACLPDCASSVTRFTLVSGSSAAPWSQGGNLYTAIYDAGAAVWNNYVYLVGGLDNDSFPRNEVQRAKLPMQNLYWGIEIPAGTATGTFSGTVNYTAVFEP